MPGSHRTAVTILCAQVAFGVYGLESDTVRHITIVTDVERCWKVSYGARNWPRDGKLKKTRERFFRTISYAISTTVQYRYEALSTVVWHVANRMPPKARWVLSRVTVARCKPLFDIYMIYQFVKKKKSRHVLAHRQKCRDISSIPTAVRSERSIMYSTGRRRCHVI